MRGDLSNELRLKKSTSEVLAGEDVIAARGDAGRGAPDALLIEKETAHRVFATLRERTARDAIGARVASMFEHGVDGAAEQAAESGVPIEDIRRARRRVFDHAAAIARESGEVA